MLAPPSLLSIPTPWLVAVLHLPPLPGAPRSEQSMPAIVEQAVGEARTLAEAGFDALLLENFHDTPFRPARVDPETVACMAVTAHAVISAVDRPVGVNVLRNDALAALGVAVASGARFVRVNVLAGAAVTDQGLVQGEAAELLRRRSRLRADVAILADVDVKHATSLDDRPVPLRAVELGRRSGADAVLVTGEATGRPVDLDQLSAVAESVAPTPVLAASGVRQSNLPEVLRRCSGVIVGSALQDPQTGRIDAERARRFVEARRS
jgi:membrane complex biogenesis BtpA family protein